MKITLISFREKRPLGPTCYYVTVSLFSYCVTIRLILTQSSPILAYHFPVRR